MDPKVTTEHPSDETSRKERSRTARAAHYARRTMSRAWWERPLPSAEAFAGLCADVHDVVRCGPSGDEAGGGRGLFATAAVAKGATIFRESPAVLVQDPRNRAETRACGCCHAMLADTESSTARPSCAWGCGEKYCDETCEEKHVRELGHRVFCVGPLDSWDHPVAALRLEAARDDDQDGLLALVQEMAARILHETHAAIAREERSGDDASVSASSDPETSAARVDAVVSAALAAASLAWFARGGEPEGSPLARASARCREMSVLVANAAAAAIDDRENDRFGPSDAAAATSASAKRRRTDTLRAAATRAFETRGVSALATLATRNQLSVVVDSRGDHKPYDGVALFPLTCLMNHDCFPNAEVRFDDGVDGFDGCASDPPGTARAPRARVVALRDVVAGEELTHAYVDVARPAQVRAAALAGFGFKCRCQRCARARGG